ncbi:hypothetical protein AC579_2843 [Pseudocercospora musae]|uniref:Uncharacterized protein n=1 Tax=Pseudocercospora musae TaxID=113226 RepID=A0A139I457_9PEZI|nr:hypothetical protein AC579_2843 [Pseudocercospora musae]
MSRGQKENTRLGYLTVAPISQHIPPISHQTEQVNMVCFRRTFALGVALAAAQSPTTTVPSTTVTIGTRVSTIPAVATTTGPANPAADAASASTTVNAAAPTAAGLTGAAAMGLAGLAVLAL